MRSPRPVTALVACGCAALTGAMGWAQAGLAFAVLCACAVLWRLPAARLLRRFALAAMALSGFLVFAPWVGGHAVDLVARGLAVTASCLVLGASVSWSALLAMLQGIGLPRALVAYLAILARHAGSVRVEVARMHRGVALRGGYRTWGNRLRSWKFLLVRLLPEVIRRADRTADALALRGFRGVLPGAPPHPFGVVDAVSAGLGLSLLAVGVVSWPG